MQYMQYIYAICPSIHTVYVYLRGHCIYCTFCIYCTTLEQWSVFQLLEHCINIARIAHIMRIFKNLGGNKNV